MDYNLSNSATPFEALKQAVKIAGSQAAFAEICGVTQTAVWKWLQSSKRLPAEHVLPAERATGVSRHHLRPDIYPVECPQQVRFQGVDRRAKRVPFNRSEVSKEAVA